MNDRVFKMPMILLVFASIQAFPQTDIIIHRDTGRDRAQKVLQNNFANTEWNEGKILLNGGSELSGLIKFDHLNGIVKYQNGEDARSFTPRSVTRFSFLNNSTDTQRSFYSLPYEDPEDNVVKPLFFEIIGEFKSFAVISKFDLPKVKVKKATYGPVNDDSAHPALYKDPILLGDKTATNVRQTETIYIMSAETGEIVPYSETITSFHRSKPKTKSKLLDESQLKRQTVEYYTSLLKFAQENKLQLKRKEDLIQILNYYSELLGEK